MKNEKRYKEIAPYNQKEIQEALIWLTTSELFFQGVKYFHPNWTNEKIIDKLEKCNSCADFQVAFIEPMIRNLIEKTIDNLEIIGLDTIDKNDNHLYISNHRDIFLDSGLLQYKLYHSGYRFTEISLGDNLIVNDVMKRVAKLNEMFTVYRKGSKSEMLTNAKRLSAYLMYAINEKKASAWIAQGNGRAKDGDDKTFPGLINMLLLNSKKNLKEDLAKLNIVVESISFEYEPCAMEKARELQTKENTTTYEKKKFEDINSIVHGIEEQKGNVCLHLEKLNINNINFSNSRKDTVKNIVQEIDRIVYKNYKLYKTNYIAHDILFDTDSFNDKYTEEEKQKFSKMIMTSSDDKDIQLRLLKIYVNPLINKRLV